MAERICTVEVGGPTSYLASATAKRLTVDTVSPCVAVTPRFAATASRLTFYGVLEGRQTTMIHSRRGDCFGLVYLGTGSPHLSFQTKRYPVQQRSEFFLKGSDRHRFHAKNLLVP